MATIEEINFNFKFEKLTLPIHAGLSLCPPTSIFDTKFSYPEKITISNKFPAKDRSIKFKINKITPDSPALVARGIKIIISGF